MKNTSFYDICMFLFEEMGDFGSEERKNIDTLNPFKTAKALLTPTRLADGLG